LGPGKIKLSQIQEGECAVRYPLCDKQGLTKNSTEYKIGILHTIATLKIGILYRKYIPLCGILFALKFLDEVTTLEKKGG